MEGHEVRRIEQTKALSWAGKLPTNFTNRLRSWAEGDKEAEGALLEVVYPVLRGLARRELRRIQADHSLEPTELINEAYLRLTSPAASDWQGRLHFFNFASLVMRRVLVDRARKRKRLKRDGSNQQASLPEIVLDGKLHPDVLALDQALHRLAEVDTVAVRVVELRYFGGLSVDETGQALGLGRSTIVRRWRFARAWLLDALR